MCVIRSLVLTVLAVSAVGKRVVTQEKLESERVDPFAAIGGGLLSPSPSNGCTLQGWHGDYFAGGMITKMLTVDVGPMSTTITVHSDKMKSVQSMANFFKNVEGTHKNAELADFFCSQPHGGPMCSFFQPGAVQAMCAKEAATAAGTAVKDAANNAVDATKDFVKENSKDPLEGPLLTPAGTNGCTLRGWSGTYSFAGSGIPALSVNVYTYSTTFAFSSVSAWEKAFPGQLFNEMNGTHTNEDLATKFCSYPPLGQAFPNACTFWSPGALGSLCPGLLAANAAKAATDAANAGYEAAQQGYDKVKNYFGWQ